MILKNIPFYSLCEHHFLRFMVRHTWDMSRKARIVGVGKLARVVDILAEARRCRSG